MISLLTILLSFSCAFGFKCYTSNDIVGTSLVSYQNKVYDLDLYNTHPVGKDILYQAYGKTLEEFFDMDIYSFHKYSKAVTNDLSQILVGKLQDICVSNQNITDDSSYDFVLNYNLLNFRWLIDNDKINIMTKIKITNYPIWFAIRLDSTYNAIIGWVDYQNKTHIDIFNTQYLTNEGENNKIFNQTTTLDLIDRKISIKDDHIILQFSTFFNETKIRKDLITRIRYYIGSSFSNSYVSNYYYYDNFYINLKNGLINDDIYKPNEPSQKEITEYYSSIVSSILFFLIFFISLVITHTTKYNFFNKFIKIPKYGYVSRGTFIFLSIYFTWWYGFLVYSVIDPQKMLFRLGLWISMVFALNLLPMTRNSIWVILFDLSFDRLIHIHKIIGVSFLISVIIKFIAVICLLNAKYLVRWSDDIGGNPLMGTIATICVILTSILSIPIIRNKMFELFFYSHKILAALIIITSSIHYITCLYFLIPSIILYGIDLLLRIKNTNRAIYSRLNTIGEEKYETSCILLNLTVLKQIKTIPGSYFFICHKGISNFEWHPISLISQDHNNLTFCIKDMGNNSWSHKLKKYDITSISKKNSLKSLKDIYIQGPYGHLNIDYTSQKYN